MLMLICESVKKSNNLPLSETAHMVVGEGQAISGKSIKQTNIELKRGDHHLVIGLNFTWLKK